MGEEGEGGGEETKRGKWGVRSVTFDGSRKSANHPPFITQMETKSMSHLVGDADYLAGARHRWATAGIGNHRAHLLTWRGGYVCVGGSYYQDRVCTALC